MKTADEGSAVRRLRLILMTLTLTGLLVACSPGTPTTPDSPAPSGGQALASPFKPSRTKTPGVTNPQVSQANIASTICVRGWTATVRPPVSYTSRIKVAEITNAPTTVTYQGHTYRVPGYAESDTSVADYELDHLIPLELGGAPADPANLWPEKHDPTMGSQVKDRLENYLRAQVCSGKEPLATAQHDIATNWYAAYLKAGSPS